MPMQSTPECRPAQSSPLKISGKAYVGIDIGAYRLDVCFRPEDGSPGYFFSVSNDTCGFKKIRRLLTKLSVACIVCEATGKLERPLIRYLGQQGFCVAVLNPVQSVNFRKVCGKLAKTDRLDAALLARFGQVMQPTAKPLPDEHVLTLRDLVVRRRQTVGMRTAESNRSLRTDSPLAKKFIAENLRRFDRQIEKLDKNIKDYAAACPALQAKIDLLRSIPGIGPVAALTLVAEMPELGSVSDAALAALAGLAPMNNDSGLLNRRAKCKGGRKAVRSTLYLAAMAARRFNKPVALFYERLVAKGKPKLVALNAAMRKLLIIANHILASGQPWKNPLPIAS